MATVGEGGQSGTDEPKTYAAAAAGEGEDHGKTPADRYSELTGRPVNGHVEHASGNAEIHPNRQPDEKNSVKPAIANLLGEAEISESHKGSKGDQLVSTKPPPGYSKDLDLVEDEVKADKMKASANKDQSKSDKKHKGADQELVSGRTYHYQQRLTTGRAGSGWQRSHIHWAPLNVPLQRRLQTLTVLMHGLNIGLMLAFFLLLCALPILWPILFPYTLYCLFSQASNNGTLSHRSEWFRRSRVWSLYASYFPARLHRSAELPPTRKYIFGYHPHGIISHGAFAAFATEALGFSELFPGITNSLLTLDSNFRIPIYRDYVLALSLQSVARESCENLLKKGGKDGRGMGRAITIVVGGARESLDADPGTVKLILGRRKGFVKLAIRSGADLVPVLGFGENELYEQFRREEHPYVHKMQLAVKRWMGFTIPLFHARGMFNYDVGLLPYRRPLNIVVGRPLKVEQDAAPSAETIDALHAAYVAELQRIWDEHKDAFARDRRSELEIGE